MRKLLTPAILSTVTEPRRRRGTVRERDRAVGGALTYNLFRHGHYPAVLCAVSNDKPVPEFIKGPAWFFEKAIAIGQDVADGFRPELAITAGNLNGLYLLLGFGKPFTIPG